jgi:hypothetical protein
MTRPVQLRGMRARIAAALITGVVAASVFVIGSSSTPPAGAQVARAAATSAPRTVAPATPGTSTATASATAKATAKAPPATDVRIEKYPNPSPVSSAPARAGTSAGTPGYGCAAALAYLHAHAEPHFIIRCPAPAYNAQGGPAQAMTCVNHPPQCPANTGVITISDPCPTAYMNEAANSWIALGLRPGALDPYGPSC